jgi:hypothetical protein
VKPKKRPAPLKTPKLSSLIFDDKNANKGTQRGRKMIAASLERLGMGRSIVVDRNGRIIAGNKTVEAARKLGIKKMQIVRTDGDTLIAVQRTDLDLKKDKRAKELAVADNRTAELDLNWDKQMLASLDVDLGAWFDETKLTNVGSIGDLEYRVIVLATNEKHQAELLKRFQDEGLTCQLLIS